MLHILITKIFENLNSILEKYLKIITIKLKNYQIQQSIDQLYIEAGKPIDDISRLYPASYEDAAIIFEEWCKGLLTECRPSTERLRKYAEYTGKSDNYRDWIKIYNEY